jgi:hypothetical protein
MLIKFDKNEVEEKLEEVFKQEVEVSINTAKGTERLVDGILGLVGIINEETNHLDVEVRHTQYFQQLTKENEVLLYYTKIRDVKEWEVDTDFYASKVLANQYEMGIDEYENKIIQDEEMELEYQMYKIDYNEDPEFHNFIYEELYQGYYFDDQVTTHINKIIKKINAMDNEKYTFIDEKELINKLTR